MNNIEKIAKEILSVAPPVVKKKVIVTQDAPSDAKKTIVTDKPIAKQPIVEPQQTRISDQEIQDALEIAQDLRTKLSGLLSALEVNIKDLSSDKSSVLKSKDRFKKLRLSLEKMQDNLSVL